MKHRINVEADCSTCGERFVSHSSRAEYRKPGTRLYCSMLCRDYSRSGGRLYCDVKLAKPAPEVPGVVCKIRGYFDCAICGKLFTSIRGQVCCSVECEETYRKRKKRQARQIRKARMRGAETGIPFEDHEIFERDGWVCQLCSYPVDRDARVPDLLAPTLDHIVPVSRGGKHSPDNAQLAHFWCNAQKRDGEFSAGAMPPVAMPA